MNDTGHSPNLLSVEQKQTGHAFNVHLLFFGNSIQEMVCTEDHYMIAHTPYVTPP